MIHQRPLRGIERAGHAQIDPDDLLVAHDDVAFVRIGMEESRIDHLHDVILRQPVRKLVEVVALRDERSMVVYLWPRDILHHQNGLRRIFRIRTGARDPLASFKLLVELHQIIELDRKIKFVCGSALELGQKAFQRSYQLFMFDSADLMPQQGQVLSHLLLDSRTTNLHCHYRAIQERGLVHLCDRGRPQRALFDRCEHGIPGMTEVFLDARDNGGKVERIDIATQLGEGLAIILGQDVGTVRSKLPDLHVSGTQILQEAHGLLRIHAVKNLVLVHDLEYLFRTLARGLIVDGHLGKLHQLLECWHRLFLLNTRSASMRELAGIPHPALFIKRVAKSEQLPPRKQELKTSCGFIECPARCHILVKKHTIRKIQ